MTSVDALFARALALEDAGRPDAALGCYGELLVAEPAHADALHNRGLLLVRLGRLAEAEQSHREYLRQHPQSARARGDLADVLLALGRYQHAVDALDATPLSDPTLLLRRGIALSCLRRLAEARDAFREARTRDADAVARFIQRAAPNADPEEMLSPENIFLARRYAAQEECDWSGWEAFAAEMRDAAARQEAVLEPAVAFMALHAALDGTERHAVARRVSARLEPRVAVMAPPGPPHRERIRVGILSPDFRDHVLGYLLLPLLELSNRSRFEWFAYSLSADDGSAIRRKLFAAADAVRGLERLPDEQAASAIRQDDVDILLDVCGYMSGARLGITFRRPARVQASYAGFSGSLGSSRVDFAIVDRVVAPDPGEWTEKLVYMPNTFYLYDFRRITPGLAVTRADYGLPERAFVFCAFHGGQKVTPDSFELWMQILRDAPGSVLWFRALSERAQTNLRSAAAARGVDPVRLIFSPYEPSTNPRYFARQRLGDLLLDALHHNAITNACDALGMGLPVLTLKGASMASRGGESLLRAAGLPELVAPDREAFVREAVRIAGNAAAGSDYKRRLMDARHTAPLFDTAGRVRDIEACLEEILHVSDQSRSRL